MPVQPKDSESIRILVEVIAKQLDCLHTMNFKLESMCARSL